ncbi:LytTR family transcriptional regulator DNA-binding domain-containing protein [Paenibacillus spongiae]|uniref:LytTR family transcriptional regulator DNA-binding domain-containing protein n=1 Tax=Paenibacillus spongiae TaxID=2909671 RepID=A0ABY5S4L9_9BACL|nr:LytTR family transcriptional regulator DNA-binding domain-containing protein [Paenibacillus spongiae]UVI28846.1 LytTR family transcriptional regulator DNA-binding domain-containing protein [Paenibacillus spongiae]
MKIPVTRDKNNDTPIFMLDTADILYIQTDEGTIVFQTASESYYPLAPSLSTYVKHLEQYGFHKLDRINLVNKNKIVAYDHDHGKVFFESVDDKQGKSTTVAFMHRSKLRQDIERWIDENINRSDT